MIHQDVEVSGNKKVKGRQRHIMVDSVGILMAVGDNHCQYLGRFRITVIARTGTEYGIKPGTFLPPVYGWEISKRQYYVLGNG